MKFLHHYRLDLSRRHSYMNACTRALKLCLLAALPAWCALPVLNSVELQTGPKGIILVLSADAPFLAEFSTKKQSDIAAPSLLTVKIPKTVYGLRTFTFDKLPAKSRVQRFAVTENQKTQTITLGIQFSGAIENSIKAKQKGTTWIALISTTPCEPYSWSSSTATATPAQQLTPVVKPVASSKVKQSKATDVAPSATPPKHTTEIAATRLIDMSVFVRDKISSCTFTFDHPVSPKIKIEASAIRIVFPQVAGHMAGDSAPKIITIGDSLFSSVELRSLSRPDGSWLMATLHLRKAAGSELLVRENGSQVIVYNMSEKSPRLFSWNISAGKLFSRPFVPTAHFSVDYNKMGTKVQRDAKLGASATSDKGTFALSDEPSGKPLSAGQTATNKSTVQIQRKTIYIIRDKLNLRSESSVEPTSTVIAQLPIGTRAFELENLKYWSRIQSDAGIGWVYSQYVADSAHVPDSVWKVIKRPVPPIQTRSIVAAQPQKQPTPVPANNRTPPSVPPAFAGDDGSEAELKKSDQELQSVAQKTAVATPPAKPQSTMVEYHAGAIRDPFMPLSQDDVDSTAPLAQNLKLVGILFDIEDRIALFEDIKNKNRAYAMREKERIKNGYLLKIQKDQVIFLITEYDLTRTFTLKLVTPVDK